MQVNRIFEAITEMCYEKEIDRDRLIEMMEEVILQAAKKKFPDFEHLEVSFDRKIGTFSLHHFKMVVDRLTDPDNEVLISEAHEYDDTAEVGDELQ